MKVEIYTGKYERKLNEKSYIGLGKGTGLSIIRPYIGVSTTTGMPNMIDHHIHLIVNDHDNQFWPVIIRLTEDETTELVARLMQARTHIVGDDKEGYNTQMHEDIINQEL